jgi:AcrR family transcriptional regulator
LTVHRKFYDDVVAGLRERKRARTRRTISDVATRLFLERGFDAVTVAEVAEAAEVSRMTVFNHFSRKEDLLLDRPPELADRLEAAVRERAAGVSGVEALRAAVLDLLDGGDPLLRPDEGALPLLRVVRESPALLARAREQFEELEARLADALADDGPAGDATLRAALVVSAVRAVVTEGVRRLLAGEPADAVATRRAALVRTFDALEAADRTLRGEG